MQFFSLKLAHLEIIFRDVPFIKHSATCDFFNFQDSDPSIRKRAVELVYLLVNETNVKPMTKELIEYLEASDPEFRGDLTAKICSIVEK